MESNAHLITIIFMAVGTYLTRALPFVIMNRIRISPKLDKVLSFFPGTILISIVAVHIVDCKLIEYPAVFLCAVVGFVTRNVLATVAVGVLSVFLLRSFLS